MRINEAAKQTKKKENHACTRPASLNFFPVMAPYKKYAKSLDTPVPNCMYWAEGHGYLCWMMRSSSLWHHIGEHRISSKSPFTSGAHNTSELASMTLEFAPLKSPQFPSQMEYYLQIRNYSIIEGEQIVEQVWMEAGL